MSRDHDPRATPLLGDEPGSPPATAFAHELRQGWSLLSAGHLQSALQAFERCCEIAPRDAQAWYYLGVTHHSLQALDSARQAFDRALEIDPDYTQAHAARAGLLISLGRPDDALHACTRALELEPRDSHMLTNMGVILEDLSRPHEALQFYDRALDVEPGMADALINRGYVLAGLHRLEEALTNHERLAELYPERADTHANQAGVLLLMDRFHEAAEGYTRALAVDSQHVRALIGQGVALSALGRIGEAQAAFDTVAAVDPQALTSTYNPIPLGDERDGSEFDPRVIHLHLGGERQKRCDWIDREALIHSFETLVQESASSGRMLHDRALAHTCCSLPVSSRTRLSLAQGAGERIRDVISREANLWVAQPCDPAGQIRVGYLSPDFRMHATALLTRRLFGLHDRRAFRVYGYSLHPGDGSDIRWEIASTCDEFRELSSVSDADAAHQIFNDRIDILVDLAGYTLGSRTEILAYRPAPVQVSYLAYHETMGADFIDYHITDAVASPPGQERFWVERLVYLPDSFFIYNNKQAIPEMPITRADAGLPDQGFVFTAFHRAEKIEPVVFDIWMRLLRTVPGSVLWLLELEPIAERNLEREAEARGIEAERLIFAPRFPFEQHLARLRLADLFLDTLWFNAHTTACDALWAGLPVLSCAGETIWARVGASLLNAIELPELVTSSTDEYEQRALYLAAHPDALRALREKLCERRVSAPLFNTERTVRNLERAYEMMWARHRAGESPETLCVSRASQTDEQS